MTEKESMLSGQLYLANDRELAEASRRARRLTRLFNSTTEEEPATRTKLLRELFHETGEHLWIEPPFHCDYGCQISVGDHFYANYDCIIVDVCPVTIGARVLFGPRVCVFTAGHPTDPGVRASQLEFGKPVTVKDDVWIGGGAILNPGVTIGACTIIGSGAVVTKDIPTGVIAVGNPCRVLRTITREDRIYWEAQARTYWAGKERQA